MLNNFFLALTKSRAGIVVQMPMDDAARRLPLHLTVESAMSPEEQVSRSFARWRDPVYRYLVASGSDPAGAEEITQESFFPVLKKLRSGVTVREMHCWWFRVAHKPTIDRRRSLRAAVTEMLETEADPRMSPEQIL